MAQKDKYSIRDLKRDFPTDSACLEFLFDALHTRECSCGGSYSRLKSRKQFQCSKCRYQIAPTNGTIFEKSATPLTLWFHAIFVFSNAKSGISAKELERQLGVTYKTAWRMLRLIREQLTQDKSRLGGKVEIDEGYFGGRGGGGRYNENYKEVMRKKIAVIAAIERGGEIRAESVPNLKAKTIGEFLDQHIEVEGTTLYTDGSNRYDTVAKHYLRHSVEHRDKRFVIGGAHVNSVEGFWGHMKRSINGTHKVISRQHFPAYLDAFVFHYNNRHSDRRRFETLLSRVVA